MFDPMFNDDPWRDAGIEADDDPPPLKPRHPWYQYAGLTPSGALAPVAESAVPKKPVAC